MAAQFTYSKKEHLKSRKLIGELFKSGKNIHSFPIKVIYAFTDEAMPLQAGVVANKRNFKRAVDRNRIKRLIREAYRLQKLPLEQIVINRGLSLMLFFIYTGKELPTYVAITETMQHLLNQLLEVTEKKAI